jgi:hypothetical protein
MAHLEMVNNQSNASRRRTSKSAMDAKIDALNGQSIGDEEQLIKTRKWTALVGK